MHISKEKIHKTAVFTALFMGGILLILLAGFYKSTLSNESAKLKLSFPIHGKDKVSKPIVFDIQSEGIPKQLAQPGKISISTGHGSGVTNKGKEPLWLNIKTEGFEGDTKIESVDPSFDKKTETFTNPITPGGKLSLGVDLDIPRSSINKYLVSTGKIIFTDSKNGNLLTEVPVKVVNSKFKQ